jgi:hypothetical protein
VRFNILCYLSSDSTFGNFDSCVNLLHVLQNTSNFKDLGIQDSDDICEGLNIDDVPLNLTSGEIFGNPQDPTKYQFGDGGIECPSMEKNLSVTGSNGPIESALEVISLLEIYISLRRMLFNYYSTFLLLNSLIQFENIHEILHFLFHFKKYLLLFFFFFGFSQMNMSVLDDLKL